MRVLVVDPDPARAALVAEGLAGVEPLEVRRVLLFQEEEAAAFAPDVIVVASDSPDRDTIENLREAAATNPRPVVMFVDRSEPGLAEQAVRAGVSAYVVDGLSAARVRSVLEVAMSRFQLMKGLRQDLEKAKADLADYGYCLLENVLHADRVAEIKARLAEQAAAEIAAAIDYVYENGSNQRVWTLLNKGQCFIDLALDPTVKQLMVHLLGAEYLLSNIDANIAGPGGKPMFLHADQSFVPDPWPPYPLVANAM